MASSSDGRMSLSLRLADKWERCEEVESEESDKESEATEEKKVRVCQIPSGKWYGRVGDLVHTALGFVRPLHTLGVHFAGVIFKNFLQSLSCLLAYAFR